MMPAVRTWRRAAAWALCACAAFACARGVEQGPPGGFGGSSAASGGAGTVSSTVTTVPATGNTSSSTGGGASTGSGGAGAGGFAGGCGDGTIDAGEECDDANDVDADGCTSCVVDCEPTEIKNTTTHHCYKLVTSSERQQAAQNDCALWGGAMGLGYLVSITSAAEMTFVQNIGAGNDRWIGAGDAVVEDDFEWISGEPWSYTNWRSGEPNDNGTQDCVEMEGDGLWDDQDCNDQKWYVCERGAAGETF